MYFFIRKEVIISFYFAYQMHQLSFNVFNYPLIIIIILLITFQFKLQSVLSDNERCNLTNLVVDIFSLLMFFVEKKIDQTFEIGTKVGKTY